jgi:S1-C subfamily serine protease
MTRMVPMIQKGTLLRAISVVECCLCTVEARLRLLAYLVALAAGLSGASASAQSCSDVISQNRAATVFIRVEKTLKVTGQVEKGTGTGFIVSPSGYVLTNRHVVERDEKVDAIVISGSLASREASPLRLTVLGTNQHDLALLKFLDTSTTYKDVVLGKAADVKVGDDLCSTSFPADKESFFTDGRMSGTGAEGGLWYSQMPSNPGDSGAPVFLPSGKVVAIKVGGYETLQNVNLLIPINLAQDLLITVPDLRREDSAASDGPTAFDQITVSSDSGSYSIANFLKFLTGRRLQVTMDEDAAAYLRRKNSKLTIRTEGFKDLPLKSVLDGILVPALPGGSKQWTYDVVGSTVMVRRRQK